MNLDPVVFIHHPEYSPVQAKLAYVFRADVSRWHFVPLFEKIILACGSGIFSKNLAPS